MMDDYYDNGLQSAELYNSATKLHEPYHHENSKREEQFVPTQHSVAEINCAQSHIGATSTEIQAFTVKKTNEVQKPFMPCPSLNINSKKCTDDKQHEKQVEEINLLSEGNQTVDKNMVIVPDDKLYSTNSGGSEKLSRLSPSSIRRHLSPECKQGKGEARAMVESKYEDRSLPEHDDYIKTETLKNPFRNKNKVASNHQLKAEQMISQLNQDNDFNRKNTDIRGKSNTATETISKPRNLPIIINKTGKFREGKSSDYSSVSNVTKVEQIEVAGNNATTRPPKQTQIVAASNGTLFNNYVLAEVLWIIFMLSTLSSATLSDEDKWPLTATKIVSAGSNVRLECTSNSENPVDWDYKPSDTGSTQRLYYGNFGLMSHDVSKRFSVDVNTSLNRYDLVIADVRVEDAGNYQCTEIFNEERQKSRVLMVLKDIPECKIQSLNNGVNGEVVFNQRQSPVILNCSVAISGNKDLTLSIVSAHSTSYPNSTKVIRSESTVTALMTIFPLPAVSLNNEVFSCKFSISSASSTDTSADNNNTVCFYPPVIIHYAVIEPILNQSGSKTCADVEKYSWCNPPCSYHFSKLEPDLCSCTVYYVNETKSFNWKCDDSNDAISWNVATIVAIVTVVVALVLINATVYSLLQRYRRVNYKLASQDPNFNRPHMML